MIATLDSTLPAIQANPAQRPQSHRQLIGAPPVRESISVASVATLVAWLGIASVSVAGVLLPNSRPSAPKAELAPVKAEFVKIEMTNDPVNSASSPQSSETLAQSSSQAASAPIPAPVAVAQPSGAIAFAVPVEGGVRIVDAAKAIFRGHVSGDGSGAAASLRPQTLVFGQGEGRQPAPMYPPRASRLGQEGVVGVRFTVDASGQVISAEASDPCVWPLLNEAAVRTVHERWQFRSGATRMYEVAIRFRLKK